MKRFAVLMAFFAWMGLSVAGLPAFASDPQPSSETKEKKDSGGKLNGSDEKKEEKKDKGGH